MPLDELIGNLKVYEVVLEKDSEISKNKKEKDKSLALKERKISSDEEVSCLDCDDEEYVMAVRDFKKFFRRRGKFVRQPHDDKKNFRKARLKAKLEPYEWLKDSGCSRHMRGNKDLFLTYKVMDIGQICDKKCKVLFSDTGSEILKDDITIGKGIRKNGLYIMTMGNSPKDSLCLTSINDTLTLWHRRLGHANM
ncbi:retrovirus-related pol polyprotein from transposon TNT 1-94 [Tanacetum coccineum]